MASVSGPGGRHRGAGGQGACEETGRPAPGRAGERARGKARKRAGQRLGERARGKERERAQHGDR